ncbi:MAG: hypothetical protein FK731_04440 [Asgard group archaeon]|nr:hypothetical protein [Asgard group archaeon]
MECRGTEDDLVSLNTGIAKISWSKVDYVYLDETHSHFEFIIDFEISNPNKVEVTLSFPYAGCTFFGNMTISFRNRNYETYDNTWIGGQCVVGYITFQPGITKENVMYRLSIEKQGLLELPDGRYDTWIFVDCYESIVDYNHTLINVRNGIAEIDYNPPTTISIGISLHTFAIYTSLCLYLFILMSKKFKK